MIKKVCLLVLSFLPLAVTATVITGSFEMTVVGGTFDGTVGTGTITYDDQNIGDIFSCEICDGNDDYLEGTGIQYSSGLQLSFTIFGQMFTQDNEAGIAAGDFGPWIYVGGVGQNITRIDWGIIEPNVFPAPYTSTNIAQENIIILEIISPLTLRGDGVYEGQMKVFETVPYSLAELQAGSFYDVFPNDEGCNPKWVLETYVFDAALNYSLDLCDGTTETGTYSVTLGGILRLDRAGSGVDYIRRVNLDNTANGWRTCWASTEEETLECSEPELNNNYTFNDVSSAQNFQALKNGFSVPAINYIGLFLLLSVLAAITRVKYERKSVSSEVPRI